MIKNPNAPINASEFEASYVSLEEFNNDDSFKKYVDQEQLKPIIKNLIKIKIDKLKKLKSKE